MIVLNGVNGGRCGTEKPGDGGCKYVNFDQILVGDLGTGKLGVGILGVLEFWLVFPTWFSKIRGIYGTFSKFCFQNLDYLRVLSYNFRSLETDALFDKGLRLTPEARASCSNCLETVTLLDKGLRRIMIGLFSYITCSRNCYPT